LGCFRDSDGRPPRHSFFFPIEQYRHEYLDDLAELCREGYGEVEVHLHHENDTAENLRRQLTTFKEALVGRHGLLSRHRRTGALGYAFIHGNWALNNSHPDGRWCGVDNELDILRETGCYADFTFPSAPDPCQPRKINSIYYAENTGVRRRSLDTGTNVAQGSVLTSGLILIQGPLLLDWSRRKYGLLPGIENGCIQAAGQPPSINRLNSWLKARVQVRSRPDWYFVKLHTHGAKEDNRNVLLDGPVLDFHQSLAQRAAENPKFRYHYVTAREMYNLVKAAEAGRQGPVLDLLDFEFLWNGRPTVGDRQARSLASELDLAKECT
jgi:hypothetical protein